METAKKHVKWIADSSLYAFFPSVGVFGATSRWMHCANNYVCRCSFFVFVFFAPLRLSASFLAAFSADAFKQTNTHTRMQKAACNYANAAVCDTFSSFFWPTPHKTDFAVGPIKLATEQSELRSNTHNSMLCLKTASVSERVKNWSWWRHRRAIDTSMTLPRYLCIYLEVTHLIFKN